LAKQTIEVLEAADAEYVVTAAASCAIAIMHDYAHLLRDEPDWRARAERLAARTLDLVSFLERVASVEPLTAVAASTPDAGASIPGVGARMPDAGASIPGSGAPMPVAYHSFCQSRNVLGIGDSGARLLRLAGYSLVDLPEASVCCGFGGATSLEFPEIGRGIVERKLANVRASGAAALCSDNPGCILHLRGAADAAGDTFRVHHLVELLAARL
jgi:L-lactate dehydrogenase complex protein LldF